MLVAPCKNCKDRNPGCHSECKKYLDFKEKKAKVQSVINRNRQLENDFCEFRKGFKRK